MSTTESPVRPNKADWLVATAVNLCEVVRYGGLRVEDSASLYDVVAHVPVHRLRRYFPHDGGGRQPVLLGPAADAGRRGVGYLSGDQRSVDELGEFEWSTWSPEYVSSPTDSVGQAVAAVTLRPGRTLEARRSPAPSDGRSDGGRPEVIHVVDTIPVTPSFQLSTAELRAAGIPNPDLDALCGT